MVAPAASAVPVPPIRDPASREPGHQDRGFHPLRVARIVPETADAASVVLDVPEDLREAFAYQAGQFCTFRVAVDGTPLLRCYSMSSAPAVDDELQVTVKRVPGGAVSNRLLDHLEPGHFLEVTRPAGVFCLDPDVRDVVAFAAGSGITPVFSLLKSALLNPAVSDHVRRVRVLYANRDADAVIFRRALDALSTTHSDRLEVVHHLDTELGFVDTAAVRRFLGTMDDAVDAVDAVVPSGTDYYLCGPAPFMDVVETALLGLGVDPARIHVERFTPVVDAPVVDVVPDGSAADTGSVTRVTIDLDGRVETTDHHPGTTILQTARQVGMDPPFSCESGSCATCMARLLEGTVEMHVNNALTDDEVEEGFILTCQSVPTSTVAVRYGYE